MDLGLRGRRALITGSTSGIGAATAILLAEEGARVVVHGRNSERANKVADEIRAAGGDATIMIGDLTQSAKAEEICAEVTAALGGIDVLVNNLGEASPQDIDWLGPTAEQWAENYNTNVLCAVRTIRAFVPGMKERGWGRVINVSSGAYVTPPVDFPAYGPAKAALVNLGVGLSKYLSQSGVTVNTISPGNTFTELMRSLLPEIGRSHGWPETNIEELERRFVRDMWPNPIGRTGRPREIAAAIAYLASDLAAYTNGANLRVDGGAAGVPF